MHDEKRGGRDAAQLRALGVARRRSTTSAPATRRSRTCARLPVDSLKIDRSFVRDIADSDEDAALTAAIVSMGTRCGLRVVAEGVETERPARAPRTRAAATSSRASSSRTRCPPTSSNAGGATGVKKGTDLFVKKLAPAVRWLVATASFLTKRSRPLLNTYGVPSVRSSVFVPFATATVFSIGGSFSAHVRTR